MNLARFFERWGVTEDPFRAEEARQDAVFRRLGSERHGVAHPDFEKIAGDVDVPTTAIVFGEKGSGKTAIRMQIEEKVREHNARSPERSALLIAYDDLNPILDRLASRSGKGGAAEAFKTIRLADHMDGILRVGVTMVTDALLGEGDGASPGSSASCLVGSRRALRAMDGASKIDLLALQAVYDSSPRAAARTGALRRALGVGGDRQSALWSFLAAVVWLLPGAVGWAWWRSGAELKSEPWLIAMGAALTLAILATMKRLVWDVGALRIAARRALSHARALSRSRESLVESFRRLPPAARDSALLPSGEGEDQRFLLFQRFHAALGKLGCASVIIVVDRVDEPTLVAGDADRMRALVWPLMHNKFLQMEGYGVKLLLPIELRYALFRESTAFFQGARLDKQCLVEKLNWTGATLYDLCTMRLQACTAPGRALTSRSSTAPLSGAQPATTSAATPAAAPGETSATPGVAHTVITLRDLFEDDVSRQDLVEALDQMRRPRDAFKMLYRCIQEHCASVSDEEGKFKIPRVLLETVKKREQERVEQLARGVRPA